MREITNRDKTGKVIDLSKIQLPSHLEVALFKILNPELRIEFKEVKAQ